MSDPQSGPGEDAERPRILVLDYDLDASVETVWRAISSPDVREKWLPAGDLAETDPIHAVPGEEVRYLMREETPPYLESMVTFRIAPGPGGGTRLTIIQDLTDARLPGRMLMAANTDRGPVMRAA
ncbi:MAG: SRPBCC domain-containing protein [Thalassobaculaceae bacterium]|nr:SRPBCC domain-containing protein [Thalassobaculaceae bacterium]